MSSILFTAWGYEVSILEFVAALTSLSAVILGTTKKRITWPWWAFSSVLYGVFFYQVDLFASAALQIVFVAAAIYGWFGWAPTGAVPGNISGRGRRNIALATFASVAIARTKFRGKKSFITSLLIVQMLPLAALIIAAF